MKQRIELKAETVKINGREGEREEEKKREKREREREREKKKARISQNFLFLHGGLFFPSYSSRVLSAVKALV
jgi:hypothetical protein